MDTHNGMWNVECGTLKIKFGNEDILEYEYTISAKKMFMEDSDYGDFFLGI